MTLLILAILAILALRALPWIIALAAYVLPLAIAIAMGLWIFTHVL